MTEKPQMSEQEASWHEHLAGMRAKAEARQSGADPLAMEAVATGCMGPVQVGRFTLRPASAGTRHTLRRIALEFVSWANALGIPKAADHEPNGYREIIELGLSTLVFGDPLQTMIRLELGKLEELVLEAEAIMFDTPLEIQEQLERHFEKEMRRIKDLTRSEPEPQAKKKPDPEAPGASNETPIPAEATI